MMTEKMTKMVGIVKKYDEQIKKGSTAYGSYFAPDIPDKVKNKLIKKFDNHIPVNSIVAVFDETLMNSGAAGIVFLNDGFYCKPWIWSKAVYFRYKDIGSCSVVNGSVELGILNNPDMKEYTIITSFRADAIRDVIWEFRDLDYVYGQSLRKSSGKVKKMDIPKEMLDTCHGIIHGAAVGCGGVGTGLAQIPCSDSAVIVPIQVGMIIGLGKVFELNITESTAKSLIASAGAMIAGRSASQILLGWIPVLGNAINTATAAGLTEAIGWIAVNNFYERWIEDKTKGRLEGIKDGYEEASGEYEKKLRRQAELFLKQKKDAEKELAEYETLLNEYEKYIEELECKCTAIDHLKEIKEIYEELKRLKND